MAIFNGIILDIHLPKATYRKLMNAKVGINDLKEMKPDVVANMSKLLEYQNDDFEEVFCLNFVYVE